MRLDEHGRWVSDDGAYVWDESAQTWQPTNARPPAGGGPAAGGTGPTAARGGGGGATGARPAAQSDTGAYGGRAGGGGQGYSEPRTGSYPLFGSEGRTGRDRNASWSPATGPYPQPTMGGGTGATGARPATGGGATGSRPASGYGGGARGGTDPLGTGGTGGWSPRETGSARGGPTGPADSTGASRPWTARDGQGSGTGAFDRADPLGTTGGRRIDPLSGPIRRDPLGAGGGTGSWTRDQNRGPAGRGGLADTGPGAARSGATGPGAARGVGATGAMDALDSSPGTEVMNRVAVPAPDTTGPLPTDDLGTRSGSTGRFGATSFSKTGSATGPRAARTEDTRDRTASGLLEDDDDDFDDDSLDQPGPAGRRGRLGGLGGRLGSDSHDTDDDDEDDDLPSGGGIGNRLRSSRRNMAGAVVAGLVIVAVVVVFVLKSMGGGDTSDSVVVDASGGRQYGSSVQQAYVKACMESGGSQKFCNCTLQKLQAGYTEQEFLQINQNVQTAEGQRVVKEIRQACSQAS